MGGAIQSRKSNHTTDASLITISLICPADTCHRFGFYITMWAEHKLQMEVRQTHKESKSYQNRDSIRTINGRIKRAVTVKRRLNESDTEAAARRDVMLVARCAHVMNCFLFD